MPEFIVRERQVITYEWTVTAEDPEGAEATGHDGVPDGARTVYFDSQTEVRSADDDEEHVED